MDATTQPTSATQPTSWLDKLNDQQRAAVTFGNDPLLIVAGAGTGKTNTLATRVAYLISTGVRPERILLLTFSRRASSEMLKRVESIVGWASPTNGQAVGGAHPTN